MLLKLFKMIASKVNFHQLNNSEIHSNYLKLCTKYFPNK